MKFKNKYIGLVLAASMAASAEAAVIAARPVVVRAQHDAGFQFRGSVAVV